MVLNFEVKSLRDDVVRVLRPERTSGSSKTAYDLYIEATGLDEDASTYDRAEELYSRAIRLDPAYALAFNNRGLAYAVKKDNDRAIVALCAGLSLVLALVCRVVVRGARFEFSCARVHALVHGAQPKSLSPRPDGCGFLTAQLGDAVVADAEMLGFGEQLDGLLAPAQALLALDDGVQPLHEPRRDR